MYNYIAQKDDEMENGKPLKDNKEWSKLLGSLLESRTDVRRIMLGDEAFQKFMKVLSQSQIPLQKKLVTRV